MYRVVTSLDLDLLNLDFSTFNRYYISVGTVASDCRCVHTIPIIIDNIHTSGEAGKSNSGNADTYAELGAPQKLGQPGQCT